MVTLVFVISTVILALAAHRRSSGVAALFFLMSLASFAYAVTASVWVAIAEKWPVFMFPVGTIADPSPAWVPSQDLFTPPILLFVPSLIWGALALIALAQTRARAVISIPSMKGFGWVLVATYIASNIVFVGLSSLYSLGVISWEASVSPAALRVNAIIDFIAFGSFISFVALAAHGFWRRVTRGLDPD